MKKKLLIGLILSLVIPAILIFHEVSSTPPPTDSHCQINCSIPIPDQKNIIFETSSKPGWKKYTNPVGYSVEFPSDYIVWLPQENPGSLLIYNNIDAWNYYNQDSRPFQISPAMPDNALQIDFNYSTFDNSNTENIKDYSMKQRVNLPYIFNYVFYNKNKIFNIFCYSPTMYEECRQILNTFKFTN